MISRHDVFILLITLMIIGGIIFTAILAVHCGQFRVADAPGYCLLLR